MSCSSSHSSEPFLSLLSLSPFLSLPMCVLSLHYNKHIDLNTLQCSSENCEVHVHLNVTKKEVTHMSKNCCLSSSATSDSNSFKHNSFVFFSFCDGKCFKREFYGRLLVILEVRSSSDFLFLGWWNVSKTTFQAVVFSNTSSAHKSHISIKHFQDCWPLEFICCWWINLTIIQRFYISNPVFFFSF